MKQPNPFQSWVHSLTAWRDFDYPTADPVTVPKHRHRVQPGDPVNWPEWLAAQTITVPAMHEVGSDGRGKGTPMQAGSDRERGVVWGYAKWGQRYQTRIPRPATGDYWLSGAPVPMFDRHCIVVAPTGTVHELIQFNPHTPSWFWWTTQALGWGAWRDGQLVEGRPVTATRLPIHTGLWQRSSAAEPHRVGVTFADYVGADGLIGRGPEAGRTLVLPRESLSYRRMAALGGECAALADAMADYGIVPRDRSGYADTDPQRIGTNPHPPGVDVHADAAWADSNIDLFDVRVADFVYAA